MHPKPISLRMLRQEFSRHSYFKHLFYTYALITCVLFFLFSSLIIYYINDDYQDKQIQTQKQSIDQAYRLNQMVLQEIYSSCYTLIEDNELTPILYGTEYSYNDALTARSLHERISIKYSSLIHSVYFINYNLDTVIDNYNREKIPLHYDQELFDFLASHTPSKSPFYGLPRTVTRNNTSAKVFSIIYHASSRGAAVININYNKYVQLLAFESNDYLDWVQVDETGRIFASSDPELFGSSMKDDSLYEEINQKTDRTGHYETTIDSTRTQVSFLHNSGLNITYISTFNKTLLYTANHMLWIILLCGICFILVGLLSSFVISLFLYHPFRSLKQKLSKDNETFAAPQTPETDDFTYLSNVYSDVAKTIKKLRSENHAWLKEKDIHTLKQLLINNTGELQLSPDKYESLYQTFSRNYYQIIVFSVDYSSRLTETPDTLNLLRFVITNVMNELFDPVVLYTDLNLVSPHVFYFINHDKQKEELLSVLQSGQTFLQEHFHITISIGIGEMLTDLEDLSQSYSSAQNALAHRFIAGNSSIIFSDDLNLSTPTEELYPYEKESAIISAIKNTDSSAFEQAVEQFFQIIRIFHLDQLLRSFLQLDASLQRFEFSAEIQIKELPWGFDILPQLNIMTLQEFIHDRGLLDIQSLNEIKSHNAEKPELIATVLSLIDENLYNPNLSVSFLANEVHLSINYLRTIFKDNTGDSLSSYITDRKIALICDLLANTDESLQDISDKLGFSTKNYFYTFFKKHMSMTPGEYRKTHQNK